jgi:prepilin-type processing-associated H-X9-DG protein
MKKHLIVGALMCCTIIASAFELGRNDAVIYCNTKNLNSAKELSFYLNKVFGKKYTVKAVKKASALPGIFVGLKPKQDKINVPADKEFTAVSAYGDQLFIYGRDNRYLDCTGYAVAEFLEKYCGVRFLWPGELGTVADKKAPVSIKDGLDLYVPPFDIRLTNSYKGSGKLKDWIRHRKIGSSIRRRGSGFQHAFASLFPRKKYGKTNPEYYSLVTPEKLVGTPKPTVPTRTNEYGPDQICTSNPEVRRIVAEKLASHKDDFVRFGKFFECPSDHNQGSEDWAKGYPGQMQYSAGPMYNSYGYNAYFWWSTTNEKSYNNGKYVWKLSMIKRNQDKTIVFADSHTANGAMTDGTHISSGSKRRHPNGFNANFFDGSAKSLMENYQVTADQQLYVWNVTSNDELMIFRN